MTSAPDPAGAGARPAFDRWVAARAHALTRFAYVLTGSLEDADEIVQEALATAYGRWGRIVAGDRLEAQVQGIAVRAHLDRRGRRRVGRAEKHPPADVWLPSPDAVAAPDDDATAIWQRSATLTPRARAVLVLNCFQGLDTPEIAELTRWREKVVRTELAQALDAAVPGSDETRDPRPVRVHRALQEYADQVPKAHSPVDRAVRRHRRRRRRRRAGGAALAAVAAVPVVWGALAGEGTPEPSPRLPHVQGVDPPRLDVSDWRWESWGGVQVQVPGQWGHADLTQWCTTRGIDGPSVDRPELVSTHALCSLNDSGRPTYTSGLLLRRAGDRLRLSRADVAPDAVIGIHTVGDVTLTVVDVDPQVGSAILSSAEVIGRRDFNGCTPRFDRGRRDPTKGRRSAPVASIESVGSVSVCRYGLTAWQRPTLVSSRRLTGRLAEDTLDALRTAPAGPRTGATGRCRTAEKELAVLELWHGGEPNSVVVRYDGCNGHGITDGARHRSLTADVLDPILVPPWSGDLSAEVPPSGASR